MNFHHICKIIDLQLLFQFPWLSSVTTALVTLVFFVYYRYKSKKKNNMKQGFSDVWDFSDKVDAIDSTHIALQGPQHKNVEMPRIVFVVV